MWREPKPNIAQVRAEFRLKPWTLYIRQVNPRDNPAVIKMRFEPTTTSAQVVGELFESLQIPSTEVPHDYALFASTIRYHEVRLYSCPRGGMLSGQWL